MNKNHAIDFEYSLIKKNRDNFAGFLRLNEHDFLQKNSILSELMNCISFATKIELWGLNPYSIQQ